MNDVPQKWQARYIGLSIWGFQSFTTHAASRKPCIVRKRRTKLNVDRMLSNNEISGFPYDAQSYLRGAGKSYRRSSLAPSPTNIGNCRALKKN